MRTPGMRRYAADILHDFRVALRRARRAPALAAAIVVTTALGLGAAAAIAATAGAALLNPLPYAEPDRLVHVTELRPETGERSPTAYPTLLDWRRSAAGFTALEGYDPANLTVGTGEGARMLRGAQVTAGFFRTLGVPPTEGRDFAPEEEGIMDAGVAVVSDAFARAQMGASAVGWTIIVNGAPHTVVGVLPPRFQFASLQDADVFLPLAADEERLTDRTDRSVHVVGRLAAGVTLERARQGLAAMMDALARQHPDALAGRTVRTVPLRDALLGPAKPIMTALLLAVALLLAIMTANLALLMLTRHVERAPELAMRSALGATRGRLLRQLAVESLMPALLGAAGAVAVAVLVLDALITTIPEGVLIGMPYLAAAAIGPGTIALILGAAGVLAVLFGVGPALFIPFAHGRPTDTRTTASRRDRRLRRGLVIAQLAVTTVLLVASGLLVTSFRNLVDRNLGYRDPTTLVSARAPLSGERYQEPEAQQAFYETLLARAAAMPGVDDAALIDEVPGGGGGSTTIAPSSPLSASAERGTGGEASASAERGTGGEVSLRITGGRYFPVMGIRVLAGRTFDARDRADAPPAAVVSAALGRLLSASGEPVGRRLRLGNADTLEWEVIGVVADVPVSAFDAEPPPVVYLSHRQRAENRLSLVMRTERSAASLAPELREVVAGLDPGVPVYDVATLEQQMQDSRAVLTRRLPMILCGVFGAAALLLSLVALYAVSMHELLARRREFGIRLAVGASASSIRRLILHDVTLLGGVGVAAGVVAALIAARPLQALMFGVATTAWRVYALVALAVSSAALLAVVGPVVKAGSLDPAEVTRAE